MQVPELSQAVNRTGHGRVEKPWGHELRWAITEQ
jgi:hypothetical protein